MEPRSGLSGFRFSERRRDLLLMSSFGALSLIVAGIQFRIPGVTGGVSDLREVAVLCSTLFLSHWTYGLGVALITSIATPADGSVFSTFAMHACGVVAAWFFFNAARKRVLGEMSFAAVTLLFVLVYYLLILLPVMTVTNAMAGLIGNGEIVSTYLTVLEVLPFEISTTAAITTLFALVHRLRSERRRALENAYDDTLEGWARALELRDCETEGHSRRVTDLAVRLGRKLGLREAELTHLRRGALLHDIGKMGVPDQILLKSGAPTDEEWEELREHPEHARRLLEPIEFLRPALDIPVSHHERWDGSGYPQGLAGEDIPFAARLFAVIDVWDALSSDRPYRARWDHKRIVQHLCDGSGTLFDPRVVEVFLEEVIDAGDGCSGYTVRGS